VKASVSRQDEVVIMDKLIPFIKKYSLEEAAKILRERRLGYVQPEEFTRLMERIELEYNVKIVAFESKDGEVALSDPPNPQQDSRKEASICYGLDTYEKLVTDEQTMTKIEELRSLVEAARAKKVLSHEFVVMYEEKLQRAKMVHDKDDQDYFLKRNEYEAELKRLGILG